LLAPAEMLTRRTAGSPPLLPSSPLRLGRNEPCTKPRLSQPRRVLSRDRTGVRRDRWHENACKQAIFHVTRNHGGGRRKTGGRSRPSWQQNMLIYRMFSAGATGLEPATSGVTGRSWRFRVERGSAGIPVNRRALRPCGCGDSREPTGPSGRLVRDERGMISCLNGKRSRLERDGPAAPRCPSSAAARLRLRRKVPVPSVDGSASNRVIRGSRVDARHSVRRRGGERRKARRRRRQRQRKHQLSRRNSKPSDGLEPSTTSSPSCDQLPQVATTGLHKGSISRCQRWRQGVLVAGWPASDVENIGARSSKE
jgi:hypothetical protein